MMNLNFIKNLISILCGSKNQYNSNKKNIKKSFPCVLTSKMAYLKLIARNNSTNSLSLNLIVHDKNGNITEDFRITPSKMDLKPEYAQYFCISRNKINIPYGTYYVIFIRNDNSDIFNKLEFIYRDE